MTETQQLYAYLDKLNEQNVRTLAKVKKDVEKALVDSRVIRISKNPEALHENNPTEN